MLVMPIVRAPLVYHMISWLYQSHLSANKRNMPITLVWRFVNVITSFCALNYFSHQLKIFLQIFLNCRVSLKITLSLTWSISIFTLVFVIFTFFIYRTRSLSTYNTDIICFKDAILYLKPVLFLQAKVFFSSMDFWLFLFFIWGSQPRVNHWSWSQG